MAPEQSRTRKRAGSPRLPWLAAAFVALAGATVAGLAGSAAAQPGRVPQPPFGVDTPAEPCVVCHSLRPGGPFRVAPNLWGIVGAEKAREGEWYAYSMALRTKGGVWTEEELDAFLADAGTFAPGSTKSIRIADAEQRRRIIDYLKTLR